MDSSVVYLDYNATTPLETEVLDTIHVTLRDAWGNASSSHSAGVQAKQAIQTARGQVADMIGAQPHEIVFTSGGTEANNLVLNTAIDHFWKVFPAEVSSLPHIVTTNIEHDSIALVLEHFEKTCKAEVTYVPVRKDTGHVTADDVMAAIRPTTCLVSVMLANNETGVIQPVAEIAERIRTTEKANGGKSPRILLHTDAAQALGKIPVNVEDLSVDYLTIVGHKFYGPRIGALYCHNLGNKTPLYPMLFGGGQERNYRPGTENTGMIAGLGKAARLITGNVCSYQCHMQDVRDYLEQQLLDKFPGRIHFNGKYKGSLRLPNTCNVSIIGSQLKGNKVLELLKHTQASTGAACHSECHSRASPILLRSGVSESVAVNALRLSVGRHTTRRDIDIVVQDIATAVETLESEQTQDDNR